MKFMTREPTIFSINVDYPLFFSLLESIKKSEFDEKSIDKTEIVK